MIDDNGAETRPWQRRVPVRSLSLICSILLLALGAAVMFRRVDWRDVTTVWLRLDVRWLIAALVVYWLQYPLNSIRLHRVIRAVFTWPNSSLPNLRLIFRVTCGAGFIAAAAPVGLVGDLAKIAALRLFGRMSMLDATRVTLFDRIIGTQWLSVLGLATLPAQRWMGVKEHVIATQALVFSGLVVCVVVFVFIPRIIRLIPISLVTDFAQLFTGYGAVLRPLPTIIQFLIACANVLTAWSTLYLIFQAAGLSPNPWVVASFVPLLQLMNSVPFLYMGWGGREIAMAATLGTIGGITMSETLAVSTAWGIALIVAGAFNGLFLLGNWTSAPDPRAVSNGNWMLGRDPPT